MTSTNRGVEVKPLSREMIRALAAEVRDDWGTKAPWFPIAEYVDLMLSRLYPRFVFHVATKEEMGKQHGLTIPDKGIVLIREDVYEGALNGIGRDRFTVAHEFGHLIMHNGVTFGRQGPSTYHPIFTDAEWQADTFAGELLVSTEFCDGYINPGKISESCGVSLDAAGVMYDQFRREGLLK